jgi:hypothetical protein
MMTNQDFEIPEGDTRTVSVPLVDADGAVFAVPAGATVRWWASRSPFDGNAALIKKTTPGTIALSTSGGQTTVNVALVDADTRGRAFKRLYHEGYVAQLDGQILRLFSGTMTVTKTLVV